MKVEIQKTERLFDGFFKLDRTWLSHQTPTGEMSPVVMRLNVERGDGAAILVVNRDRDSVLMVRQFRLAAWLRGDAHRMLEIPAGTIPPGKTPAQVARSELIEEVGYRPRRLRRLMTFYSTPGTTTERTHLYYAEVSERNKVGDGGGLDTEHEFIEIVQVPVARVMRMLARGELLDAKTVIALQWLEQYRRLNKKREGSSPARRKPR